MKRHRKGKKGAQERLIITIYSGKLQVCIGPSVHTELLTSQPSAGTQLGSREQLGPPSTCRGLGGMPSLPVSSPAAHYPPGGCPGAVLNTAKG